MPLKKPKEGGTRGSLTERYKAFKEENGEMPIVETTIKIVKTNSSAKAILSKEIEDRDGEIVLIKGVEIEDPEKGVPLLDAHKMTDSIVDNILGRVRNIKKRKKEGVSQLEGDLDFAPTPRGQIAKMLVEGGFADTVSIGFGVKEFDPETRTITKSVLFETSIVSVPANPEAKIDIGKGLKEAEQEVKEIEKRLKYFDEVKPVIKQYRQFFMLDLAKQLGLEKTGDEILDIKHLFDVICSKVETQPKPEVKNSPKRTIKVSTIAKMIEEAISKQA